MECAEERCRAALQLIDFGGEDEVAFGQSVDFVCPGGDLCLPPDQKNVGMMSFLFGDLAHEAELKSGSLQREFVVQRVARKFRNLGWPMTGASLELHLRSESENDSTLRTSSHVCKVLNDGLQKEHR
jgi:hypothetical protein